MKVKTSKVIEEHSSDSNNATEDESVHSEQSEDEDETRFNAGWADAVSKILKTKKPKGKSLVLGKAKKINEVKKVQEKSAGFEVQTKEGDVKEVKLKSSADQEKLPLAKRKKKRELTSLRVKPDILDKDRERMLCKIATRGVVQLFNSVKSQQKDISEKLEQAGPLEVRKDKVMKSIDKRAFLDVLMGEKSKSISLLENTNPKNSDDKTTWNVLRDDFMMDAKLKNWDKQMEDDEEEEEEELEREQEMEVE